MDKPQTGDIWEYTRDGIPDLDEWVSFLLIVDDTKEDYYVCMNLVSGEVGDWLIDYGDEFHNWRQLA